MKEIFDDTIITVGTSNNAYIYDTVLFKSYICGSRLIQNYFDCIDMDSAGEAAVLTVKHEPTSLSWNNIRGTCSSECTFTLDPSYPAGKSTITQLYVPGKGKLQMLIYFICLQ